MNKLPFSLVLFLSVLYITCGYTQTLSVPVGQQAPELQGISVPKRGMTQMAVESEFGSPLLKGDPVGQPAISSWEYASFQVYFENDRVLHTVLKHTR